MTSKDWLILLILIFAAWCGYPLWAMAATALICACYTALIPAVESGP